MRPRRLTITQILAWADAQNRRTGQWPKVRSGPVRGEFDENWRKIDNALSLGLRGLPGGSSLAKLLAKRRGAWNLKGRPILTIGQILFWADDHRRRTGKWPTAESGPVHGAAHDTWSAIDGALKQGIRGLAGGTSLARLLSQRRGKRNRKDLPRLTLRQVLAWAEAHHRRTGRWPRAGVRPHPGQGGETWRTIDCALRRGTRGLPGGSSLAQVIKPLRRRPSVRAKGTRSRK